MKLTPYVSKHYETIVSIDILEYYKNHCEHMDWSDYVETVEKRLQNELMDWEDAVGINPDGCIWFRFEGEPPHGYLTKICDILKEGTSPKWIKRNTSGT